MNQPSPSVSSADNTGVVNGIAIGVVMLGVFVLIFGWAWDITAFKSVLPGLVSMKANAALGFILCGASLALFNKQRGTSFALWMSALAMLLGLLTFSEYVFDWDAGIDQWLFNDSEAAFTFYQGRMSIFTAMSFVLVADALLLLNLRKHWITLQVLALTTGLFALLPIVGYLFGNLAFPYFGKSSAMALHTAIGFLVLSIGILIAAAQHGLVAGQQWQWMHIGIRAGLWMLLISSIAVVINMKQDRLSTDRIEDAYQILMTLDEITEALYKHQKIVRDFLLIGNEQDLIEADETRVDLFEHLQTLNKLIALEPIHQAEAQKIMQALLKRFEVADQLIQERRLNGLNAAAKLLSSGESDRINAALNAQIESLKVDETLKLTEHQHINQLKDTISQITWGFSLTFAIATILLYIKVLRHEVARRKLNEARLQFAANVFSHAREGITITDAQGTILEVNDSFCRITGYQREEVIGKNPRILQSDRQSPQFYRAMWRTLLEKGHWDGEIWNRRKNGDVIAEILNISSVQNHTGITQNYVALFTDITAIKEHQYKLEHIAQYDALTDLPNRVLLADRLAQAMLQCQRRHRALAVVFLDLDGFKSINDDHGHDAGDALLIVVSQRMKENLREGDTLARIGGDEFVAVLVDLEKSEDCEPILERLLEAASDPIIVGDKVLHVSASLGVTVYPQDKGDVDQLMRHADQAMYIAKQSGKNRYHYFDFQQNDRIKANRTALTRIEKALARGEFKLYIQPKMDLKTGIIVGAEALIRWQHPVRGLVPPNEFLPLIQDQDLAISIGNWVIEEGMRLLNEWGKLGLDFPLSVNVSARQLRDKNFCQHLAATLSKFPEVPPQRLEIEIVESAALDDIYKVSALIADCKALGVNFSLDDFGTGYSSLIYLKRLAVDTLKIDQSFVRDMLEDQNDLAIVRGIIGLAQAFNNQTVAEGVETWQQAACLNELGCEIAQGYAIACPMAAEEIPEWITNFLMPKL